MELLYRLSYLGRPPRASARIQPQISSDSPDNQPLMPKQPAGLQMFGFRGQQPKGGHGYPADGTIAKPYFRIGVALLNHVDLESGAGRFCKDGIKCRGRAFSDPLIPKNDRLDADPVPKEIPPDGNGKNHGDQGDRAEYNFPAQCREACAGNQSDPEKIP